MRKVITNYYICTTEIYAVCSFACVECTCSSNHMHLYTWISVACGLSSPFVVSIVLLLYTFVFSWAVPHSQWRASVRAVANMWYTLYMGYSNSGTIQNMGTQLSPVEQPCKDQSNGNLCVMFVTEVTVFAKSESDFSTIMQKNYAKVAHFPSAFHIGHKAWHACALTYMYCTYIYT